MASNTIFSKPLTTTDIEKQFAVPMKALTHFPQFADEREVDIVAKDDKGFFWSFGCVIRQNGYKKPIFSASTWLPFVRFRGLEIGDTITLYEELDEFTGVNFKIEVVHMEAIATE